MSDQLAPQNSSTSMSDKISQWEKPARYMAAAFLVVAIALSLLFLVPIINTVALGFIIAFLMYLPIRALARRTPIRYPLAVITLYVLLVIIIVLIVVAGFSIFVEQTQELATSLREAVANLENHEDPLMQLLSSLGAQAGTWLAKTLLSIITGISGLIGLVVIALFFSFLLLLALGNARATLADWVPSRYQREATLMLMKLDQIWVGYMTAQVIYGAALGTFSFLEYALLGVPFPFVMAVVTGFVSLIPSIGGLLASLIVAIPCLLLGSTVFVDMSNEAFALLVMVINVVITQVTYNFFALPIVGKFVKLPTVVVFAGVLVGFALGSIVLAFLSVPILSTARVASSYILSKISKHEPFPDETVPDSPEPGFFSQLLLSRPLRQK